MKTTLTLFVVLGFVSTALSYTCESCLSTMCCNIPSDHEYYLTDFCAGYPHAETSCGNYCNEYKYFSADRQRFGCHSYLNVCRNSRCSKVYVIDAGPAAFVENNAGKAVIDASPAVCNDLAGATSCGWSDRITITAVPTTFDDGRPLGTFSVNETEYKHIIEEGIRLLQKSKRSC